MISPTISAITKRGESGSRRTRLRRTLAQPHRRRPPTPSPTGPVMRRIWREVAPGEWRWIHVQDQEASE
jgi:hypothetical protein